MWITGRICMRVMDTMGDNPVDWSPFERECAAKGQKVLHYSWRLIATMSQESVKTHADAQAGGYPPEHYRGHQRLPTEDKERGYRSKMQESHENCGMPVNACRLFSIHQFVAHFEFSNHRSSFNGVMGLVDMYTTRKASGLCAITLM
jgi:hypothetical protein